MANAIEIKGINLAVITDEQRVAIAAAFGIDVAELKLTAPKVSMGKLEGLLDESGNWTCPACGKVHNYNELDEQSQAQARKSGVCPDCYKIFEFVKGNKSGAVRVKNVVSAGEMCRNAVLPHLDAMDDAKVALLTDKENCKKKLGIAYPLFLEIPAGTSKKVKDEMRKPDGKNARFAAAEYAINGKVYVMCNDLYQRNVPKFEAYMAELFKA